jgi:hypothetical protein
MSNVRHHQIPPEEQGLMESVSVAAVAICLGSLLYAFTMYERGTPAKLSHDRAREVLGEVRQWGTFLIGTQTAAIGFMGYLLKEDDAPASQLVAAGYALVFFGTSVFVATWILGAVPSLLARLTPEDSEQNDVFHLSLFDAVTQPQIGPLTGLQYILFSFGVVAFTVFIYCSAPPVR